MTEQDRLWDEYLTASRALKALGAGSGPKGLTPDAIKQSPEYQEAKRKSDAAFKALRRFNATNVGKRRK